MFGLGGLGFRRLLAARVTSGLADGWFQAGLAGSLLFNPERQASPLRIALGFAILLLPYSLLGPYVGVLLDRWQRRNSLALANFARALLVLPAAAFVASGDEGFTFAILALLVIAANRFFLAGMSASLPHVVLDEKLVTANAVASTFGTVSYTLGLGTALGVLHSPYVGADFHGYGVITVTAAVGYLVSALLLRTSFAAADLGPPPADRPREPIVAAVVEVARGMIAGIRHLTERPVAGYALLVQAGHRVFFGVLTLAGLLMFSQEFVDGSPGQSLSGIALLLAAGMAGVLVGAAVTPSVTRRIPSWAWVSVSLGATAVAVFTIVPLFHPLLFVIPVVVLNVAAQSTKIIVDTNIQHECADEYRGRVFSVNDTAFNLTFVGGLFIAATTLPVDGRSVTAAMAVAAGYGVLAVGYVALARRALAHRTGTEAEIRTPDAAPSGTSS
ncbi:MAG TPA: MFS transporter [Micromonosporaceae bacterium]|nr:MFS transporter [Micromonosporaceae bacterium]